jgi:hypothetical protein
MSSCPATRNSCNNGFFASGKAKPPLGDLAPDFYGDSRPGDNEGAKRASALSGSVFAFFGGGKETTKLTVLTLP